MIEAAGYIYNPPDTIPNTLPSLFLAELARDQGSFDEVHRALFRTYWSEARNIGDIGVLEQIAKNAGLDIGEFADALSDLRYTTRIAESTDYAHGIGVTGVPAWLIDGRILVIGAQPHEVFEQVLQEQGYSANAA